MNSTGVALLLSLKLNTPCFLVENVRKLSSNVIWADEVGANLSNKVSCSGSRALAQPSLSPTQVGENVVTLSIISITIINTSNILVISSLSLSF